LYQAHDASVSDSFQNTVNSGRETVPGLLFGLEADASGFGEGVELCAAIVFRFSPLGLYPYLMLEAMERGVKSALVDAENVVGELADAIGDSEAVHRAGGEDLEDEEVEGALQEFVGTRHLVFTSMIDVSIHEEDRHRK
jgi:hypothetical protein